VEVGKEFCDTKGNTFKIELISGVKMLVIRDHNARIIKTYIPSKIDTKKYKEK
jgi:hypothetical protein